MQQFSFASGLAGTSTPPLPRTASLPHPMNTRPSALSPPPAAGSGSTTLGGRSRRRPSSGGRALSASGRRVEGHFDGWRSPTKTSGAVAPQHGARSRLPGSPARGRAPSREGVMRPESRERSASPAKSPPKSPPQPAAAQRAPSPTKPREPRPEGPASGWATTEVAPQPQPQPPPQQQQQQQEEEQAATEQLRAATPESAEHSHFAHSTVHPPELPAARPATPEQLEARMVNFNRIPAARPQGLAEPSASAAGARPGMPMLRPESPSRTLLLAQRRREQAVTAVAKTASPSRRSGRGGKGKGRWSSEVVKLPLQAAVRARDSALVAEVLDSKLCAVDSGRPTALHVAATVGDNLIAALLLSCGADVNIPTATGRTALMIASAIGNAPVVRELLKPGASRSVPNLDATIRTTGTTALHLACAKPSLEVAEMLLQFGASPNVLNADGSPLHYAAGSGDVALAVALLAAGADQNAAAGGSGSTPLHLACQKLQLTMAALLVMEGASTSAADANGLTPLAVWALAEEQADRGLDAGRESQLHGMVSMKQSAERAKRDSGTIATEVETLSRTLSELETSPQKSAAAAAALLGAAHDEPLPGSVRLQRLLDEGSGIRDCAQALRLGLELRASKPAGAAPGAALLAPAARDSRRQYALVVSGGGGNRPWVELNAARVAGELEQNGFEVTQCLNSSNKRVRMVLQQFCAKVRDPMTVDNKPLDSADVAAMQVWPRSSPDESARLFASSAMQSRISLGSSFEKIIAPRSSMALSSVTIDGSGVEEVEDRRLEALLKRADFADHAGQPGDIVRSIKLLLEQKGVGYDALLQMDDNGLREIGIGAVYRRRKLLHEIQDANKAAETELPKPSRHSHHSSFTAPLPADKPDVNRRDFSERGLISQDFVRVYSSVRGENVQRRPTFAQNQEFVRPRSSMDSLSFDGTDSRLWTPFTQAVRSTTADVSGLPSTLGSPGLAAQLSSSSSIRAGIDFVPESPLGLSIEAPLFGGRSAVVEPDGGPPPIVVFVFCGSTFRLSADTYCCTREASDPASAFDVNERDEVAISLSAVLQGMAEAAGLGSAAVDVDAGGGGKHSDDLAAMMALLDTCEPPPTVFGIGQLEGQNVEAAAPRRSVVLRPSVAASEVRADNDGRTEVRAPFADACCAAFGSPGLHISSFCEAVQAELAKRQVQLLSTDTLGPHRRSIARAPGTGDSWTGSDRRRLEANVEAMEGAPPVVDAPDDAGIRQALPSQSEYSDLLAVDAETT